MPYRTVARAYVSEDVVKGSRFVAFVAPVRDADDALTQLEHVRARHAAATHHPFAYRVGLALRFSDDGEPGGTAGRPLLETLQKRDLNHALAVVTRYYGGVKLGAGGLVRAYGGALVRALDAAEVVTVHETVTRTVLVPFAEMSAVHRLLGAWAGLHKEEAAYTAAGLELRVTLPAADETPLADALAQATRGEAVLRRTP